MRRTSTRVVGALAALLACGQACLAQDLGELEFEEVPAAGLIVASPSSSALIVETTVVPLEFNSRGGVREVQEPERGVYRVLLTPGVHNAEVRAAGYLPLRLPRWNFAPKEARKIRVRPKLKLGPEAAFAADRPVLRLEYAVTEGTAVYVQLDQNPPQKLDFSQGYVLLRPTPGEHLVQVFADGRLWQQRLALARGQQERQTVALAGAERRAFAASHPGNLFVESTPAGAAVYLNQVQQAGTTPLTLNDLQPGAYQVEVVLPQHLPAQRVVQVQSLEYADVRVDLAANYGHVQLATRPAGATVYVSGQQRGQTPLQVRLDAGTYPLRLALSNYHDHLDTLRVRAGDQLQPSYDLQPAFGAVRVTSAPPGAQVEADGQTWDRTPLARPEVLSGRHVLRARLAGYPDQEQVVDVLDGQEQAVHFDLSRSVAQLNATTSPPGASVTIKGDGRRLGTTPIRGEPVPPGTYTLVFTLAGYDTEERVVPFVPGAAPQVDVELHRQVGHIRVETTPPHARIYLDGSDQNQATPHVLRDLPVGRHQVRLELPGHDPRQDSVLVQADQVASLQVTLGTAGTQRWQARRATARRLAVIPGLGQLTSPGQAWRGGLYLAGLAAAGYLAWDGHAAYNQHDREYQAAMAGYHLALQQADMDRYFAAAAQAVADMDAASQRWQLGLIAVGSVWAIQLVDAFVFGGGRLQAYAAASPPAAPAGTTALAATRVGLRWRF